MKFYSDCSIIGQYEGNPACVQKLWTLNNSMTCLLTFNMWVIPIACHYICILVTHWKFVRNSYILNSTIDLNDVPLYCIRWNIGKSIIWQNKRKHFGRINIGDFDKIISYMCLNLQLRVKVVDLEAEAHLRNNCFIPPFL